MLRYSNRYWKRTLVTILWLIGYWMDGTAGCDLDSTMLQTNVKSDTTHHNHHHHHHHHHHRHLEEEEETEIELCGVEDPDPAERFQDQLNMLIWSFQRDTNPDAPPINYTIPVYFHILQFNSTDPLVSDSNVDIYMTYLSNAFSASAAPFRFVLMGITRTVNATISNDCRSFQNDYKPRLKRGGKETMNVYVCNSIPTGPNGGSITGFATLPSANPGTNDGVTIVRTTPTDLNRPNTLVHEVGHYLGLQHTFIDNCTTTRGGDLVDDTPYHISLASQVNCRTPTSTWDTCPTLTGLDPVDNYMTYTVANHACRTKFTPGQVDRMKAQFEIYRYVAPPPTKAPTKRPTKTPTSFPILAPSINNTGGTFTNPLSPINQIPTSMPIQNPNSSTTTPNSPLPIAPPIATSPTAAPVVLAPMTSPTTTSPVVGPVLPAPNVPVATSSPIIKTTNIPSIHPTLTPTISPSISISPSVTTVPITAPTIISAAPIGPKCKFYFSLCDEDDDCCVGVCRKFLSIFQKRCSIFMLRNV